MGGPDGIVEVRVPQLSAREQVCLELCAHGLTDREVGEKLSVTRRAVRFHISNILRKLSARNRTHAVLIACSYGLLNSCGGVATVDERPPP